MYKVSAGLLKWTCKEHNRATPLEMHAEIYERKPTNGCREKTCWSNNAKLSLSSVVSRMRTPDGRINRCIFTNYLIKGNC